MGRLPGGVDWRGKDGSGAYYVRVKGRWRKLGSTIGEMSRKLASVYAETGDRSVATVAEFAERWLRESVSLQRNEKCQRLATTRVREYLVPYLGKVRIADVTPERLRQYARKLARHEWAPRRLLSPQTQRHVLSDCRAMLLWALDIGVIDRSPIPRRLMPKVPERAPQPFTAEERGKLEALDGADGLTCRIALGTGLRWGELLTLQAKDVRGREITIVTPKNGKVRRIPIAPSLADELMGRVGRLLPWRGVHHWAFTMRVRRVTGIAEFRVHRMRHDFACTWLERGGSLAALQRILGHSSVTVTERYGRLSDDMIRREAERIYREFCPNSYQATPGTALTEDSAAC